MYQTHIFSLLHHQQSSKWSFLSIVSIVPEVWCCCFPRLEGRPRNWYDVTVGKGVAVCLSDWCYCHATYAPRDRSLITGRGTGIFKNSKGEGKEQVNSTPQKKGGGGSGRKSFNHPKGVGGGDNTFWGSINLDA